MLPLTSLSIKRAARQAGNLSGRVQHVHQIFRPYFFRRPLQFALIPPMVIRHAFEFVRSPPGGGQAIAGDTHMKISLILVDVFAVCKLKDDLALPDLRADMSNTNAGFFPQFPDCGFFERFVSFNPATWRRPIADTCKRPCSVLEAKQQYSSKRVGDQ